MTVSKSTDESIAETSARIRVRLGTSTEGFGRFCVYAIERDGAHKVGSTGDLLGRVRQIVNGGVADVTVSVTEFFDNEPQMKRAERNAPSRHARFGALGSPTDRR